MLPRYCSVRRGKDKKKLIFCKVEITICTIFSESFSSLLSKEKEKKILHFACFGLFLISNVLLFILLSFNILFASSNIKKICDFKHIFFFASKTESLFRNPYNDRYLSLFT
jgi:hypothetical protein